jgi:hypothetical protein
MFVIIILIIIIIKLRRGMGALRLYEFVHTLPSLPSPPCPTQSQAFSRRSHNAMGDAGATAVAAGLPGLVRLETLILHRNDIGGAGGLAIAREAARLPALRTLCLREAMENIYLRASSDTMDAETKAAIRTMLPRVEKGLESL